MTDFITIPVSSFLAQQALSQPNAQKRIVTHKPGFPCRHCLKDGEVGEEMILFSFTPLEVVSPYQETGPIFVHANGCKRAETPLNQLPGVTLGRADLVVRAYHENGDILAANRVSTAQAPDIFGAMLDLHDVAFLHVRAVSYGCYAYRVERA